jgi:ribonuclease T1
MKRNLTITQKISLLIGLIGIVFSVFALDFTSSGKILVSDLPKEAQVTLALIKQGGPFLFEQDGKTFGNYEGRLPKKARGYYREYTVKHPKARSRGAKRIISGGNEQNPHEFYYTSDHYNSFKQIIELTNK